MSIFWNLITDFGDAAVLIPAALGAGAWLLATGAWREAVEWLSLFFLGAFLVAASKVAFMGWGIGVPALDFRGISGHAMLAVSVLPVATYLVGGRFGAWPKRVALTLGFVAGLAIALSRLAVGAHSLSEVIAGAALGATVASVFVYRCEKPPAFRLPVVSPLLLAVALYATGHKAPSQEFLGKVADYLSGQNGP